MPRGNRKMLKMVPANFKEKGINCCLKQKTEMTVDVITSSCSHPKQESEEELSFQLGSGSGKIQYIILIKIFLLQLSHIFLLSTFHF